MKNRLGIHDEARLDNAERDIPALRLMQLESVKGDFDYDHLKRIHKFIFGDLFDWAGQERIISMVKGEEVLGGLSVNYAYPDEIEKQAKKAISALHKTDWDKLSADGKAEKFARLIAQLWQAHPFREGNTRGVIAFACEFARAHGFPMDKELISKGDGYTRDALVMASIGQYSEYEHLTKIFRDSMLK